MNMHGVHIEPDIYPQPFIHAISEEPGTRLPRLIRLCHGSFIVIVSLHHSIVPIKVIRMLFVIG